MHTLAGRLVTATPFRHTTYGHCLKPEYGKAIHSLAIDAQPPTGASGLDHEDSFDLLLGDAMTMALFQWRARSFWLGGYMGGEEVHDKLVRSLAIGLDEGIMALVLLMCPNITELDISMPENFETSVLGLMLLLVTLSDGGPGLLPANPNAYESPPATYVMLQIFGTPWPDRIWQQPLVLRQLKELTLRNGDMDISSETLRGVLSLPALEILRIYGLKSSTNERFSDRWPERTQLRRLHLAECYLRADVVATLIQHCPRMNTL